MEVRWKWMKMVQSYPKNSDKIDLFFCLIPFSASFWGLIHPSGHSASSSWVLLRPPDCDLEEPRGWSSGTSEKMGPTEPIQQANMVDLGYPAENGWCNSGWSMIFLDLFWVSINPLIYQARFKNGMWQLLELLWWWKCSIILVCQISGPQLSCQVEAIEISLLGTSEFSACTIGLLDHWRRRWRRYWWCGTGKVGGKI